MVQRRHRRHSDVDVILIFGESPNDSEAVKNLVVGLCPPAARQIKVVRRPPSLQRSAGSAALRSHAGRVADIVRAQAALADVTCVLVHSDADGSDPGGAIEQERTDRLREAGIPEAHAVVPAHSIETWWLLFPDATESVVDRWRGTLRSNPGNVDAMSDPKGQLVRRTRRGHGRRPYQESDSPEIAQRIAESGFESPRGSASRSFERFRETVASCCARLPRRR